MVLGNWFGDRTDPQLWASLPAARAEKVYIPTSLKAIAVQMTTSTIAASRMGDVADVLERLVLAVEAAQPAAARAEDSRRQAALQQSQSWGEFKQQKKERRMRRARGTGQPVTTANRPVVGRPAGSKNRPKGRPPGSKNRPKNNRPVAKTGQPVPKGASTSKPVRLAPNLGRMRSAERALIAVSPGLVKGKPCEKCSEKMPSFGLPGNASQRPIRTAICCTRLLTFDRRVSIRQDCAVCQQPDSVGWPGNARRRWCKCCAQSEPGAKSCVAIRLELREGRERAAAVAAPASAGPASQIVLLARPRAASSLAVKMKTVGQPTLVQKEQPVRMITVEPHSNNILGAAAAVADGFVFSNGAATGPRPAASPPQQAGHGESRKGTSKRKRRERKPAATAAAKSAAAKRQRQRTDAQRQRAKMIADPRLHWDWRRFDMYPLPVGDTQTELAGAVDLCAAAVNAGSGGGGCSGLGLNPRTLNPDPATESWFPTRVSPATEHSSSSIACREHLAPPKRVGLGLTDCPSAQQAATPPPTTETTGRGKRLRKLPPSLSEVKKKSGLGFKLCSRTLQPPSVPHLSRRMSRLPTLSWGTAGSSTAGSSPHI